MKKILVFILCTICLSCLFQLNAIELVLKCNKCDLCGWYYDGKGDTLSIKPFGRVNDTIYVVGTEHLHVLTPFSDYSKTYFSKIVNNLNIDVYETTNELMTAIELSQQKEKKEEQRKIYEDSLFVEAVKYMKKVIPNAYIDDWDWENDYGTLNLWIKIANTSKKKIKYVTVYWQSKNDVGDVRDHGYLKGTGPVEPECFGYWHWDNTFHFLSGDVTYLSITKIVITYMNGSSVTLYGKSLKFSDDANDIILDYFKKHYNFKD